MIYTKELRQLAQAASHPTTKGRWMRLFGERTVYDRMEDGCRGIPVVSTDKHPPSPFEAACLDFIAAANPAVINELLDRLEAAEDEVLEQARLNGIGAERELALMAKLEATEKDVEIERMRLAACGVAALGYFEGCAEEYVSASLNDVLALRAKIEAMEKQEPVGLALLCVRCSTPFDGEHYCPACGHHTATEEAVYALPDAPPAPSEGSITAGILSGMFLSLDGHDKAQPGYEWRKGWNDAIRQAMDYAQPAPSVPEGWKEGVEDVAAMLQKKADDYADEYGYDDMGGLSFGGGMGGEVKMDYYNNLIELIEEVRAMLAAAPEAKP